MDWRARTAGAAFALAIPAIMAFEGRVLTSYQDPVGIWTACDGYTGPLAVPGAQFTAGQCDELLLRDLLAHYLGAMRCVTVELRDNEAAAVLSFAYNVGVSAFCNSTFARRINAGELPQACAELSRWVYAKGVKLRGLERRRAAEREMCEGRRA